MTPDFLQQLPHGTFRADSPPDQEARLMALDPTRSFAVSAPAGSGKTGLLTQRVLALLARCEEPESILAITFTRKAAGEMQERIMAALHHGATASEPDNPHQRRTWQLAQAVLQRDSEQHWQLLLNPQRLRIQTIDSLCRSITRLLPLDSQLGAAPDTLETPELAYRQAVRQFLARLEDKSALTEDLKHLLRHLDANLGSIESLLVRLLAKRDQWLGLMLEAQQTHARDYLESVLQEVIVEQLQWLTETLSYHASDLCLLADTVASNLAESHPDNPLVRLKGLTGLPPAQPEAVPDWQALAGLMLTNTGQWRKRLTVKDGFPSGPAGAGLKAQFAELVANLQEQAPDLAFQLQQTRELPPATYTESQWTLLESLTRLLPLLSAELTLVFRQLGATDYSAITQATSLALGDAEQPGEIALQLDYRIQHILVDEFQDTAAPQLRLLEQLTRGWQPNDGRTLFIVGDGMQSCYGFRDANVGLFLDARAHGIGDVSLTPLDLSVNFRSQADIVRWVNTTFQQAFPAADDIGRGAVRYSPSIAFNAALEGPAVECLACFYQQESEGSELPDYASPDKTFAQLQQAEAVAELAAAALKKNDEDSVAILVRNRTHLEWILPALARRSLHWQATEIDRLHTRMAIVDLMSLTRALLNPDDRIAWLSVLRAPWCGLDLHDLHRLITTELEKLNPRAPQGWPLIWLQLCHRQQITGLSTAGQDCLERFMSVLEPAWHERQRKPLRLWIEGIWLALGGPALIAEAEDRDEIPRFFQLLEQHQYGGGVRDWEAFEQGLQKLYAAPKADANPRLQVMTLHKSKGLEFDTVIIPELDRTGAGNDKELLLWQQRINRRGERRLLLGPLAPTGAETDPLYQFISNESKLRESYEATRLLYVGCTRAIKQLYLLASVSLDPRSDKPRKPHVRALLHNIWESVQEQFLPVSPIDIGVLTGSAATQGATLEAPLQHSLRLAPEWQAPILPQTDLLRPYRGREFGVEENLPEAIPAEVRLARQTGTLLHRLLQQLTETPLTEELASWSQRQRPFWTMQLHQSGWSAEQVEAALEKIDQGLQQTWADPDGRWLLNRAHEDNHCELPVQHGSQLQLSESIIDRTFVCEGIRWIVDYKSSQPAPEQSLEDFLAQEIQAYRPQLARYTQVITDLGEQRPIRTALYFPLVPSKKRLIIVEPEVELGLTGPP